MPTVMRMRCALVVLALYGLASPRAARGDVATDQMRARQLASFLGLASQIDEIVKAPRATTVEEAIVRSDARDDVVVALSRAGLELEAVRARLLHEEYQAKTAHDIIERGYQDSVGRWSIAAVLQRPTES